MAGFVERSKKYRGAALKTSGAAHTHDLILVTRNARDFANTCITVYNPWTDETHQMEAP